MGMKLKELVKKLEAARDAAKKEGEEAIKEAFGEFFEAHPIAKAIVWTQYSPHFNDGDACTFSVNSFELHVDTSMLAEDVKEYLGKSRNEDEDEDDPFNISYDHGTDVVQVLEQIDDTKANRNHNYMKYKLRKLTEAEKKLVEDFNELEKNYCSLDDLAEQMLGNHVKVVVTRSGLRSEEYDHE